MEVYAVLQGMRIELTPLGQSFKGIGGLLLSHSKIAGTLASNAYTFMRGCKLRVNPCSALVWRLRNNG